MPIHAKSWIINHICALFVVISTASDRREERSIKLIRKFIYRLTTPYRVVKRIINRCIDDKITIYSAQATFFLTLSLLPFAMITVSLLRFLIPQSMGELWRSWIALLPLDVAVVATRTLHELLHTDTTSVISLSLLVALWSASKGIMGLELGMHVVYRNNPRGNYLIRRLRCTLYTLIFIVTLCIGILLLVFGRTFEKLLASEITFFSKITLLILGVRTTIMFVLFVLVFTLGYKYMTGTSSSFFARLPGVLFSTIGWILFTTGFGIYINNFSNYTYLYGSMGAVMLFFLWLYFCMVILLAGAEVNCLIKEWREGTLLSYEDTESGSESE